MRIDIGDILIVNPSKMRVRVVGVEKSFQRIVWLKDYWHRKYDITLPKFFDTILVNFPSHDKVYEYPRYRKCIKRPLRQKKQKKLFKISQKELRPNIFRKIKRRANRFEEDDPEGILEHEVFDL